MRTLLLSAAAAALAAACAAPPQQRSTLRDLDISGPRQPAPAATRAPADPEAIRRAYLEFLAHAPRDDKARVDALYRLAQLEFQLNEKQAKDPAAADSTREQAVLAGIDRNIELLQILLRDHPDAANADRTLYQLARAYDQRGLADQSIAALEQLVAKYPKSPHYVEAKFRLAERAFIRSDYGRAEDLYTDVLVSRNNALFRDKARYKRGWARFKQNFYREAIDDYVAVIGLSNFDDLSRATEAERSNFDEYFRALALSFVYQGGPETVHEYFRDHADFRYIPQTYLRVSDLYLAEQRYADAAGVLDQFIRHYPQSPWLAEAALRRVNVWAASGFHGNFARALEDFYAAYHPQSGYWSRPGIRAEARTEIQAALRTHILLAGSRAHRDYQAAPGEVTFTAARTWYERYLRHYASQSRKDNVHFLYAELLSRHGRHAEALTHYEQAAFDGDIIVNADAAYGAIATAARLHQEAGDAARRQEPLGKLIHYSLLYVRLHPGDRNSVMIATRAAQEAYRDGQYAQAIELAQLVAATPQTADAYELHKLRAHAYFKSGQFEDAEAAYQGLLTNHRPEPRERIELTDNLALSVYSQAVAARTRGATSEALRHFARMADLAPASETSATGLYEAITLASDSGMWPEAVRHIERFKTLYPSHALGHDVSKKLTVAYLNTRQDGAAASELVKASRTDEDMAYKTAALWKAAELYASGNDHPNAIKAYEEYATRYPRPYPQYLEAMHRLSELHIRSGNEGGANQWRQRLLDTDRRASGDLKTDRTNYLASLAALHLARQEQREFAAIRLTLPLNRSLARKKDALQRVLNLYGQAASYGVAETATEATYGIADVYHAFSRALLESDRPRHLNAAELEQYQILLEDQAFPFEDNAIKFHEKNLAFARDGIASEWIQKSHTQLRRLFPARYDRTALLESHVNVLH